MIETYSRFEDCAADWAVLQHSGLATPYQTFDWLRCWCDALAAPLGITPLLVVMRGKQHQPIALFPLGISLGKGLHIGVFLGGKHANMNMGLFDRSALAELSGEAITAALREVASRHQIDLFHFENQPRSWEGVTNPLASLAHQASPSSAWKATLQSDDEAMISSLMSSESRKKLRYKEKKLAEIGPFSINQIAQADQIEAVLEAFFTQKAQRFGKLGIADPFADAPVKAFIHAAARAGLAEGRPALSLFALKAGERILSVFGGAIHAERFTGMFTSFDADPEVAKYSPGDLLLLHLVRLMCRQGLHTFDLGTGDATYKNDYCKTEEPLFDTLLPMTWRGHVGARMIAVLLAAKRRIKKSQHGLALLKRLRGLKGT